MKQKIYEVLNNFCQNTNEWCYPEQLYRLGMYMFWQIAVARPLSNAKLTYLVYTGVPPDSTNFGHPGNCTIAEIVWLGDWFSTKIAIYDF